MNNFARTMVIVSLSAMSGAVFAQSAPAAAGDPDAMKKLARTIPNLDIVGIKLGMSPQEATAAIKAANPKLKIDLINTRLHRPGVQQFDRVPHWIVAHTVGLGGNFAAGDHSKEVIAVQFTMPPGHSVVARVMRELTFPDNEPVMASNLIGALHKKYGEGEFTTTDRIWMFDSTGKLIANAAPLRGCVPATVDRAFPGMSGRDWLDYDPKSDYGEISLDTTIQLVSNTAETQPACMPLTLAQAKALGEGTPPNRLMNSMTTWIESPALLNGSRKATHDWLQQLADVINKKKDDGDTKRPAPKL